MLYRKYVLNIDDGDMMMLMIDDDDKDDDEEEEEEKKDGYLCSTSTCLYCMLSSLACIRHVSHNSVFTVYQRPILSSVFSVVYLVGIVIDSFIFLDPEGHQIFETFNQLTPNF